MPSVTIDAYRASFQGGARSYLFYHKVTFPAVIGANSELATYLVRTTNLPEVNNEEIMTQWQGFDFPFSGKATYSDWTVSFNVDKDAKILKYFYDWSNLIHDPTSNTYNEHNVYFVDQQLELLGLDSKPITKYKLIGAWPRTVGTASLDYSSNDVVQFDVTYRYLYFVTDKSNYAVTTSFA